MNSFREFLYGVSLGLWFAPVLVAVLWWLP